MENARKNIASKVSDQIMFLIVTTIILIVQLFIGCNRTTVNSNSEISKDTLVAEIAPITSMKERCEKRWFNSASDNPRCYKLQEALITGAYEGNLEKMKNALKEGANVEAGYQDSYPALYTAATAGQKDAVLLLLNNGANVNRLSKFSETPLKRAVFNEKPEVVKILLERGADVCVKGDPKKGEADSALNIAFEKKNQEIIKLLEDGGASRCLQ